MNKKIFLVLTLLLSLWVALFNLPPGTPLSDDATALFKEYHLQMNESPVLAELSLLKALVVEAERLCDTSESDCLEWLAEQRLQSIEAENAARQIIRANNFSVNKVLALEEPYPPYAVLYNSLQSYLSRVLRDPTLWAPLLTDLQKWCSQQMELVGYVVCLALIEQTLDIGEYLITEGKLDPQSVAALPDDGMRMALIGEWVMLNTYIDEALLRETFGWKYWVAPKLVRQYLLDAQAMVNASAEEFLDVLSYLDGNSIEPKSLPCNECGEIGKILHRIASPNLSTYIDRHHRVQARLISFETDTARRN